MAADLSVALKKLHELLHQLGNEQSALAQGPRAIATAEKHVAATEQLIEQQKHAIKTARKTADEFNLKLKSREAELSKLQGQLNTASSNKEFDIIKGQVASATKSKGEIEDAALAAMDAIDSAQKSLKDLEAELQKKKQEAQAAKALQESKAPALRASIEALLQQLAEAEKVIPAGPELANYHRLRGAHAAGALSEVEDNFCSACNNRVTAQDMVLIRTGEFRCCRGCGRILYVG
jgi:predicted  nucleic acid-binding Zn-ribbon protein